MYSDCFGLFFIAYSVLLSNRRVSSERFNLLMTFHKKYLVAAVELNLFKYFYQDIPWFLSESSKFLNILVDLF
jgi:hypothetical protein